MFKITGTSLLLSPSKPTWTSGGWASSSRRLPLSALPCTFSSLMPTLACEASTNILELSGPGAPDAPRLGLVADGHTTRHPDHLHRDVTHDIGDVRVLLPIHAHPKG